MTPLRIPRFLFPAFVMASLLQTSAHRNAHAVCDGPLFGTPVQLDALAAPHATVIADFDEDGHNDVAVAASNLGVALFLGSGSGQFNHTHDFMTDRGCFGIVTADFNQDGILDLAAANVTGNNVSILLGLGTGGVGNGWFAPAVNYPTGPGSGWGLATGDFDENGAIDLVVSNNVGMSLTLLRGLGDGTFVFHQSIPLASNPTDIQVADVNEDGISDLVVAIPPSAAIWVLRGLGTNGVGNGTFAAPISHAAGPEPFMFDLGDLDSDGILDLAVANGSFGGVRILRGGGTGGVANGGFSDPQIVVTGNMGDVIAVDINQDGILDLLSTRTHSADETPLVVSTGHGDRTFDVPQLTPIGRIPLGLAVGNLGGSPALDVAVCSYLQNRVSVLLGLCELPTAVDVAASEPVFREDGAVQLAWHLDEPATVDIQRSIGAIWDTRASVATEPSGAVRWTDHEVSAGITHEYRLRLPDGTLAGRVSIRVPEFRFALDGVIPNPAQAASLVVRFHLGDRHPARLEMVDVGGRRIFAERVDALGPGEHVFKVNRSERIPAGVYLVRLISGTRIATTRAVVIP